MSKVVVVKYSGKLSKQGCTPEQYLRMLSCGFKLLTGKSNLVKILQTMIPANSVIGMKTNCLARRHNSTPVALTQALTNILTEAGFDENDIIIWERTNRELSQAGFTLNAASHGIRCFGTDTNGVGYSRDFYTFGDVNSLVTRIITDIVDYNINLPVLKDHSIAGLSAGLKNMYGAINNPNKYHDNNCDPFCAHISNLRPIKEKNHLTILDAIKVQYHGGPGYVSKYIDYYHGIIISTDPVAADTVGLKILQQIRKNNGLPVLEKVERPVKYLKSAEQIGLGVTDWNKIDIRTVTIDKHGSETIGELF